MSLQNALGNIALDATVAQVRDKLSADPSTAAKQDAQTTRLTNLDTAFTAGIRAQRRDADTTTAADGESHQLYSNSGGRLKVSAMPGDYVVTTGDITTTQPVINTPVAGGTVAADVSKASNVVMYCTGTFSAVNVAFEASIDNGVNWFSIQAVRSNANTVETTSGSLSAAPAYSWEMSVNAYTNVRVRATARTSGTQSWRILPGAYATEPVPAIQPHAVTGSGTFTISGAVTVSSGAVTVTPTAATPYLLTTAATTNAASVKTSSGNLYEISVSNPTTQVGWIKLFNKASAPTLGTDLPIAVLPVTANSFQTYEFGALGKRFSLGIAIAVTANQASTDATVLTTAGTIISGSYV